MSSEGKRKLETAEAANGHCKKARSDNQYTTSPQFIAKLLQDSASSLYTKNCVVYTAEKADKVKAVWKGMALKNILSVPILNKVNHKYYGLLELNDIVLHVIESFGREELSSVENFWDLVDESDKFQDVTVKEIAKYPFTKSNRFHPVGHKYSLLYVFEVLARERSVHRVPVVQEDFTLVNIVTQSMAVRYLAKHLDQIGSVQNKPVSEMKCVSTDVVSVKSDVEALECFKMMIEKNISGLAVTDANNTLLGNISLRDLKKIGNDGRLFWRLYQTVGQFLGGECGQDNAFFVNSTDSLARVISVLSDRQCHRVYVCDGDKKPTGVISLKDVLLEIISSA